jgi:hypothetical protein
MREPSLSAKMRPSVNLEIDATPVAFGNTGSTVHVDVEATIVAFAKVALSVDPDDAEKTTTVSSGRARRQQSRRARPVRPLIRKP